MLIILCLSAFNLQAQQTVGVLDITPKQGVSEMEADIVTDFVYDALYRLGVGRYLIISRQNREAILAEHEFALSCFCDDASCALEVGKYLSADYVILGSFTRFGSTRGNASNGYTYAGSNSSGGVAWYKDNTGSKIHQVGGKQSNELGLYDMSGNLWKWCWDWYDVDYHDVSPAGDPTGPSTGSNRRRRA